MVEEQASVADSAFASACDLFRQQLSKKDEPRFSQYPSADLMISEIHQIAKSHPIHSARMTRCATQLHEFTVKLSKFYEIVSIFAQINSMYAGAVWGSMRLIFQLGCNYVTFIENISKMFDEMKLHLPAYEEYFYIVHTRAKHRSKDAAKRLTDAMKFLFTDVIQFCHRVYKLFSPERFGLRQKVRMMRQFMWKPFDQYFEDVSGRFKTHTQLFLLEMEVFKTAESMEAQSKGEVERFRAVQKLEKLEYEATKISKMQEDMKQAQESILELFSKLQLCAGASMEPAHEDSAKNSNLDFESQIATLLSRIQAPSWTAPFDRAQNNRLASSGSWLLQETVFLSWNSRSSNMDGDGNYVKPFLFFLGKPGYGKTTLCATVIDYFQTSSNKDSEMDVAYYFFDKQQESNHTVHALRAILNQLIHRRRADPRIIDVAILCREQKDSGHLIACFQEVFLMLRMLLSHERRTVLIFDAIDESTDGSLLIKILMELQSTAHNCKVIIFSRPTVRLPRNINDHAAVFELLPTHNVWDQKLWLNPRIQELIDYGDISPPKGCTVEEIVDMIASRSDGMFLWTNLLVEYLKSPILSTNQKWNAIKDLNRLKGLDSLYNAIMSSLIQKSNGQENLNIMQIFVWVLGAYRPLSVKELQVAAAISTKERINPEDLILNLDSNLGPISGALLELTPELHVKFIHLSVREYLIHHAPWNRQSDIGVFDNSIQKRLIHQRLSSSCIAYYHYNIPSEPLSGSSKVVADATVQQLKHPMLLYSTQFLSKHVADYLSTFLDATFDSNDNDQLYQVMELLANFLKLKPQISVWIEASWMFKCKADFGSVPKLLVHLTRLESLPEATNTLIQHLAKNIINLNLELDKLSNSWREVLHQTPNEIWEPSVSAFAGSLFWESAEGASIEPIAPPPVGQKSILIRSSVSEDGTQVGVIRLISELNKQIFDLAVWSPRPSVDYVVVYELRSLQDASCLGSVSIALTTENLRAYSAISRLTNGNDLSGAAGQIEFPNSISSSLMEAVVLDYSIRAIPTVSSLKDHHACGSSDVEFHWSQMHLAKPHVPYIVTPDSSISLRSDAFPEVYGCKLSPQGEYLLVYRNSRSIHWTTCSSYVRLLEIFKDSNYYNFGPPCYKFLAYTAYSPTPSMNPVSEKEYEKQVVFHPYLPELAFCRGNDTVIWHFQSSARELEQVHDHCITNLQFSENGNHLFGFDAITKEFVMLSAKNLTMENSSTNPHDERKYELSTASNNSLTPLKASPRNIQGANTIFINPSTSGQNRMSSLRQDESKGALVLITQQDEENSIRLETISRLPLELASNADAVLLHQHADDDSFRVLLNGKPKDRISLAEFSNPLLPSLLTRLKSTVPTALISSDYATLLLENDDGDIEGGSQRGEESAGTEVESAKPVGASMSSRR